MKPEMVYGRVDGMNDFTNTSAQPLGSGNTGVDTTLLEVVVWCNAEPQTSRCINQWKSLQVLEHAPDAIAFRQ